MESCELCVASEDQGNSIAFLRCPACGSYALEAIDLRDRHSIFTPIEQLASFDAGLALPWVGLSVYSHRTESLIQKSLPKLSEYNPQVALLDEEDSGVRAYLADAFPERFDPAAPKGTGALIWIVEGTAVVCDGGPYVTEYEIIKTSRALWSRSTE